MSWSDDTRCLYCEGRLPLYRKITHGQFCSSAHRKSYWQEQERLAVERLHQTHNSLRAYRSTQIEAPEESTLHLEPVPAPFLSAPVLPAADPVPVLDESPLTVPDLIGSLVPEFLPRGGSWPDLVAADPFEYEFTCQPLAPSPVFSNPETRSFPEGQPLPAWACMGAQLWTGQETQNDSRPEECEPALCHPRSQTPAPEMRAAGRVGLALGVGREARGSAAPVESTLQALEIALAPVTDVHFEVAPKSDVLVELLDQQVPHPDRLHALGQFPAHQAGPVLACSPQERIDASVETMLPSAATPAAIPDYQLSACELRALPAAVLPAHGSVASSATISEIPANPQVGMSAVAMPPVETSAYQVGTAGLQSLSLSQLQPAQGAIALQTPGLMALDLSTGVSSDITLPNSAPGTGSAAPRFTSLLPLTFGKKRKLDVPRPEPIARLLPQAAESHPVLPHSGLEPLDRKPPEDALRTQGTGLGSLIGGEGLRKLEPVWAHATGFWQHAPRDLKLLLFAIPALLALVFHQNLPRVAFAAPQSTGSVSGSFKRVLNDELVNVRQTLENRAAIALDEDFRSGLDNWASPGGSTTEWSFDSTGFVRPGPLALYRPSVSLADYQVQFLGLIDKKALSWVVRAADFDNFYVVKLVVLKSGPLPAIGLTRYAVIDGKAQDRHDVSIPLSARADTLYNVNMNVQGSNFSVEVQGQMADSWTETRLPRGGVGFFTARGEESRVRWVQITHQYDMLGRLCAYLAPYDTTNGSWQP